jgi:hypothetical protein
MSRRITCPRCSESLQLGNDPFPGALSCPRCLASVPTSTDVRAEPPPPAPTYRGDGPRIPDVDVRRDFRGTVIILVLLTVLGVLGFLGAVNAQTDRGGIASAILVLLVAQAFLVLVIRALLRASMAPGASTGWTVVRSLLISGIVIVLLGLAMVIFLCSVCVVSSPHFH